MHSTELLEFFGVLMHAQIVQFLVRWEENTFGFFQRLVLFLAGLSLSLCVFKIFKVAGDANWENGDVPVCCNCFIYETRIDDLFVIS